LADLDAQFAHPSGPLAVERLLERDERILATASLADEVVEIGEDCAAGGDGCVLLAG
jgi:hypothetical protein